VTRRRVLLVSLMALFGCTTLAQTRYYSLSSGSPPPNPANETPAYRVAIGPATVPEALDRMQMVLRIAPNRYAISDTDRWSVPLKREIPRVLAEEVGHRLASARVAPYEQHSGQDADYRVLIDVVRLESVPGDSITLEAVWVVRNRSGESLRETRSVIVDQVNAPGVAPLVATQRSALAALGREIADAVDALTQAKR